MAGEGQYAKRKGPRPTTARRIYFDEPEDVDHLEWLFPDFRKLDLARQYVDPRPIVYCRLQPFDQMMHPPVDPLLDHFLGKFWIWVKRPAEAGAGVPRWVIVNLRGYTEHQTALSDQRQWIVSSVGRPSREFFSAYDDQLDLYYELGPDVSADWFMSEVRALMVSHH
jgi:hypothetical protein